MILTFISRQRKTGKKGVMKKELVGEGGWEHINGSGESDDENRSYEFFVPKNARPIL